MAEAIHRYNVVEEIHMDAAVALVSGQVEVIGNRIGIYNAINPAASGDRVAMASSGVWDIEATDADEWDDGDLLYWDPATNKITDVAGALEKAGLAIGAKATTTSAKALIDVNKRAA